MAEPVDMERVTQELGTIIEKMSELNNREKEIEKKYEAIEKASKDLESAIEKQQSMIEGYKDDFIKKTESLKTSISAIEGQINQCNNQIGSFIDKSNKLAENAESFEKYVNDMKRISKAFEHQVEEAKAIQNQLMIQKMDILISKAEKLTFANESSKAEGRDEATNVDEQHVVQITEDEKTA